MNRQVWGSHVTNEYTDDSDAVALLHHSGHVALTTTPPTGHVIALFDIAPGLPNYSSSERANFRSKSWGKHRVTLKVKSVNVADSALVDRDALKQNHVTDLHEKERAQNGNEVVTQQLRPKKVILSYDQDEVFPRYKLGY